MTRTVVRGRGWGAGYRGAVSEKRTAPPAASDQRGQVEPARRVALEALSRVQHGGFLAPTLHELLSASGLPREERAVATDLAYGTLRRLLQLDTALAPLLTKPDRLPPGVLDALRLGAYEILYRGTPAYAAVNGWAAITKVTAPRLTGLVNAVLRRVVTPQFGTNEALAASLPAWLYARFGAAIGDHAAAAAAAMLEPEPLWLTALAPEAARVLVEEDGATVAPLDPLDAESRGLRSLRVKAPVSVDRLVAFVRGLVQPQNPASLAVALSLGASEGDRVLDLASGRGVKTAALAALGAHVTAVELEPRRQAAAVRNLRRLGLEAHHVTADLRGPLELTPAPYVLLDAPCSGTGTLRGHPEIKLRLAPADVKAAAQLQSQLLATAAAVTAPGGLLTYAVCALTPDEGPGVVGRFLAAHGEFTAEPSALLLPHVQATPGSYILPFEGLDGFYLARLRRRP